MLLRLDGGNACCAIVAADEVLERLEVPVEKAIDPLDPSGFMRIVAQIRRGLQGATGADEARAMREAIGLLDVDWARITPAAREAVVQAARTAIGATVARAMPRVSHALEVVGPRLAGASRASTVRRFGLEIGTSLLQRDLLAERYARTSAVNFIRDQYGVRRDDLSDRARQIVASGLEAGFGRDEIAARISAELGDRVMRGQGYWQTVASQFANQARTFSQIGAFEDAGIEQLKFTAILDEVTTDECRFYDGMVFPTSSAAALRDRLANASPDEVYDVAPWVRSGRDEEGNRILYIDRNGSRTVLAQVDRSGVGTRDDRGSFSRGLSASELLTAGAPPTPPLHGNCRSTIEPASIS